MGKLVQDQHSSFGPTAQNGLHWVRGRVQRFSCIYARDPLQAMTLFAEATSVRHEIDFNSLVRLHITGQVFDMDVSVQDPAQLI